MVLVHSLKWGCFGHFVVGEGWSFGSGPVAVVDLFTSFEYILLSPLEGSFL